MQDKHTPNSNLYTMPPSTIPDPLTAAAATTLPKRRRGRPSKADAAQRAAQIAAARAEIEKAEQERAAHPQDAEALPMPAACQYASPELLEKVKRLNVGREPSRARNFLIFYANTGYQSALTSSGLSWYQLDALKKFSPEFAEIYAELQKAHDGHTVARTVQTLERCANGEFIPTPGALPPDMRAASLLLPALDPRFKANAPSSGNQVQINISI